MRLVRALAVDPIGAARALPGEFRQRHGSVKYGDSELDRDWFERLHELIGAPWPCAERERLAELLAEIDELLAARGLGTGRHTYGWYSDAEVSLCSAVWCAVLHRRPENVIETGVAHGVTSRVILEALRRNDRGRLWSIDLPHPLEHQLHAQTGAAVPDDRRDRWTYLEGSSRQRLGPLVAELGRGRLVRARQPAYGQEHVVRAGASGFGLEPGGVMLADDIKSHDGFAAFARRHPEYETLICESEDKIGVFGIAVKGGR